MGLIKFSKANKCQKSFNVVQFSVVFGPQQFLLLQQAVIAFFSGDFSNDQTYELEKLDWTGPDWTCLTRDSFLCSCDAENESERIPVQHYQQ